MWFEGNKKLIQQGAKLSWPLETGGTLTLTVSIEEQQREPVVVINPEELPNGYSFDEKGWETFRTSDNRLAIRDHNGATLLWNGGKSRCNALLRTLKDGFEAGKQTNIYFGVVPGQTIRADRAKKDRDGNDVYEYYE